MFLQGGVIAVRGYQVITTKDDMTRVGATAEVILRVVMLRGGAKQLKAIARSTTQPIAPKPVADPSRMLNLRTQDMPFKKTWAQMTMDERRAFQHVYDRHAGRLGLPQWSERNADKLIAEYNRVAPMIKSQAQVIRFDIRPAGRRGSGQPGRYQPVRVYEYTDPKGTKFFYMEDMEGNFISAGQDAISLR
jgi:hypothetical protein